MVWTSRSSIPGTPHDHPHRSRRRTAALDWLAAQGWRVAHGPDIAPGTSAAERDDYGQVVLERRLRDALAELNPALPASALDDALRRLTRPEGATLEARNRAFHRIS